MDEDNLPHAGAEAWPALLSAAAAAAVDEGAAAATAATAATAADEGVAGEGAQARVLLLVNYLLAKLNLLLLGQKVFPSPRN